MIYFQFFSLSIIILLWFDLMLNCRAMKIKKGVNECLYVIFSYIRRTVIHNTRNIWKRLKVVNSRLCFSGIFFSHFAMLFAAQVCIDSRILC